jgi:hypothetical protein
MFSLQRLTTTWVENASRKTLAAAMLSLEASMSTLMLDRDRRAPRLRRNAAAWISTTSLKNKDCQITKCWSRQLHVESSTHHSIVSEDEESSLNWKKATEAEDDKRSGSGSSSTTEGAEKTFIRLLSVSQT